MRLLIKKKKIQGGYGSSRFNHMKPILFLYHSEYTYVPLVLLTGIFLMLQTRHQACQGNAALWTSWYWQDTNGSPDWKDVKWQGTKGIKMKLLVVVCNNVGKGMDGCLKQSLLYMLLVILIVVYL